MLSVQNISKSYSNASDSRSSLLVLDHVSFDIRNKEFVSILGPSGCGKTTLIRILAGLIESDEGCILVDGVKIAGPGPERCMVFQNFGLLPWRTIRSNVEFGLEAKTHISAGSRKEIAARFIDLVGLNGFKSYYPHQVSGGMQQRVGIARALACDPQILLMDEPFGAVDEQTREELQEELLRIWEAASKTIIFVTHSIEEAIFLSDRIVLLKPRPGRLAEVIDVDLPRPRNSIIQGHPNFIKLREDIRQKLRGMRERIMT